jgi:hypothetical protein
MCSNLPPTTPHELYEESRAALTRRSLMRIYNKSQTEVYRWCRNPLDRERGIQTDAANSPLECLVLHIRELIDAGRIDLARAARDILNREIGDECFPKDSVKPDKATVEEELLDTYPCVIRFHQAIRDGDSPDITEGLCRQAKRELDEDQVKYCEKWPLKV